MIFAVDFLTVAARPRNPTSIRSHRPRGISRLPKSPNKPLGFAQFVPAVAQSPCAIHFAADGASFGGASGSTTPSMHASARCSNQATNTASPAFRERDTRATAASVSVLSPGRAWRFPDDQCLRAGSNLKAGPVALSPSCLFFLSSFPSHLTFNTIAKRRRLLLTRYSSPSLREKKRHTGLEDAAQHSTRPVRPPGGLCCGK